MRTLIREPPLVALGEFLRASGYRFTTVTPDTHRIVLGRADTSSDYDLRDIFGWNRCFLASQVPDELLRLLLTAAACVEVRQGCYRSTVRFATLGEDLFVHSGFPTQQADAVFFGPDSYRFVRAILPHLPRDGRLVDVGAGSGVAGIVAKRALPQLKVVLADINDRALALARVNARLAGVDVEVVKSDGLSGVGGSLDTVISNPPYLSDPAGRAYRNGGGPHGAALSARFVREALARLGRNPSGGLLLMYSGAAQVAGVDCLLAEIEPELTRYAAVYDYEELDCDVFGSELESPDYADVERIAAVLLRARVRATMGA